MTSGERCQRNAMDGPRHGLRDSRGQRASSRTPAFLSAGERVLAHCVRFQSCAGMKVAEELKLLGRQCDAVFRRD